MEEGRRMFQIFAARMFEQRVLQAYREKVANERQQRLLEELAEEDDEKEAEKAKKMKEAQKRKQKKDKQRQAKAEEKARKDAEQAAKEAEVKAAEEKRLEDQRRKREEQRKKKDAERKAQEEERQRKEAERVKRQQEERERQQEAERKAREHKLSEKKAKEELKRKEREEREAREKEAREKKAQEDKERRERDVKAKVEKERSRRDEQTASAAQSIPSLTKKTSQPVAVALPPQLLKQQSSTGYPSPQVTPAVPKAPTPSKPRQASQQGSHGSSPKVSHALPGTSKSMSPASQAHIPVVPKSILTKPANSQQPTPAPHAQPSSPMPLIGPPPGMSAPPGMGMANMPPGLNGFHGQGPMMPGMMGPGRNMPIFPPGPGPQNYRSFPPPPGMHPPNVPPMGRGFPMEGPPPGFGPMPSFTGPNHMPGFGMGMPTHSRQTSGSYDKPNAETPIVAPVGQPVQRPAPIQRPSSVKPHEEHPRGTEIDELASHLGSSALIDDADDIEEIPRRTSLQQHGSLRGPPLGFGFPDAQGHARPEIPGPFAGSNNASVWGTPPLGFPMPGGGATWGNSPTTSFFPTPFPTMGTQRGIEERRQLEPRLAWLRRQVCNTCKMLSMRQPSADGFIDAEQVHDYIDSNRAPSEAAVTLPDIKEACEFFGDSQNGGGALNIKESTPGRLTHIKFTEVASGPPPTLGEIGSPVPSHSVPVGGFGAPGPLANMNIPGLNHRGW